MSTRSMILITGKDEYTTQTYSLYKHSDGYPTGNLPIILEAIKRAKEIVDASNKRWADCNSPGDERTIQPNMLTGCVIGAATSEYGMGASIEETYQTLFKPEMVDHGDIEWMYLLNTDDNTLKIYGCEYEIGYRDPMSYVEELKDECQDDEAKETKDLLAQIKKTGFTVNPPKKPAKKPVKKTAKKKPASKPTVQKTVNIFKTNKKKKG